MSRRESLFVKGRWADELNHRLKYSIIDILVVVFVEEPSEQI